VPVPAVRAKRVAGFTVHHLHEEELDLLTGGIFEREQYRFDYRGDAPRILDCGAHIGLSVLYFKRRFPRARITAFEPNPDTFALLVRNVHGNGFTDVELVNAAVAEQAGVIGFHIARDPCSWHWGDAAVKNLWFSEDSWQTIHVPAVSLAAYLVEPIDYLKLDIEGLETRVLTACASVLPFVQRMIVEFHGSRTNPGNELTALRWIVQGGGFTTALRQGDWLTREADLNRTEPYTVVIHAYQSRTGLAWFLRRDVEKRVRLKLGFAR
jgi:FkbM family methyltransferase